MPAARVALIGGEDVIVALEKMRRRMDDPEEASQPLADLMRRYVHVDTGYLKSTIYHEGLEAVATAPYAAYEARRGGTHDFATRAAEAFNINRYADRVVRDF